MRVKLVVIVIALISVVLLTIFGSDLKDVAANRILGDIPEYNCGDEICTSCVIDGSMCNCGQHVCECGNKSVNRKECNLV